MCSYPDALLRKQDEVKAGVWGRLLHCQGKEFFTVTGKGFTFSLDGDRGIWFYRNGRRILKRIRREEIERAAGHCPVTRPSEFGAGLGSSYLFGLLMDNRIRQSDW